MSLTKTTKEIKTNDEKDKSVTVTMKDVAIDGKYNPALFLASRLGSDPMCQDIINRGMDTMEVRKFMHRCLLEAKSSLCSDLFRDRNHKASDFKLGQLDTCSYCGKKVTDLSKLYLFLTVVHMDDLIVQEILKRKDEKTRDSCVFKTVLVEHLECKVRDVRFQDGFAVNGGCALVGVMRCQDCLGGDVDKITVD